MLMSLRSKWAVGKAYPINLANKRRRLQIAGTDGWLRAAKGQGVALELSV